MNDRLRIASEQLAASLAARPMDGWQGSRIAEAVRLADALIAAAGDQEDYKAKFEEVRRDFNECVAANSEYETANADLLARAEAAEARASALQSKLDEAARLAMETAGEAMRVAGGKTCEWTRIGGDGPWHPACLGERPHVSWSEWSRSHMAHCPHCTGKIVKGRGVMAKYFQGESMVVSEFLRGPGMKPVVVIPEGDWRRLVELAIDSQVGHRPSIGAEIKAIIERTEKANG